MNPWEEYAAQDSGPWDEYAAAPQPAAPPTPTALGSTAENLAAGFGRGVVRAGLGIKGILDAGATRLENFANQSHIGRAVSGAGEALGLPTAAQSSAATQADLQDSAATDQELLGSTAGNIGSVVGSTAVALPAFLVPGAQSVAGSALMGGVTGAALTPGSVEERAKAGALNAVGAGTGTAIGKGLQAGAGALLARWAEKTAQQTAQNAVRDTAAAAGREVGYVLPPVTANPTWTNRVLEGFAGKLTTAQQASMANQNVTNRLARQALGLSEDAPITKEALAAVRKEAGEAYQALDDVPIVADTAYARALQALTSRQTKAAAAFPGKGGDPLSAEIDSLVVPEFTGGQATAKISLLREQANAAFAKGDRSLASGLNGAAKALEDVMDRNLQAAGNPSLLKAYRLARVQIARAHTVERALNESTGNVSAKALAKQMDRGKPLSGELKTAAQMGQAFPKATAEITESMPGISPLDFAVGALGSAGGGPAGWSLLLGRPAVRNALLSRIGQSSLTTPSYGPNALAETSAQALQSRFTPNALAAILSNRLSQE